MSYSVEKLINEIDEHPLRWEVITLESVLSLPTLSIRNSTKCVDFFFYPVGGPQSDRKIGLPYYSAFSAIDSSYEVNYEPIQDEVFKELALSDNCLGPSSLSGLSRNEYDAKLTELYKLTDEVIPLYWNSAGSKENSNRESFHRSIVRTELGD